MIIILCLLFFLQVKFYCIWLYFIIHFIKKKSLEKSSLVINIIWTKSPVLTQMHHHSFLQSGTRVDACQILIILRKILLPSMQLLRKLKLLLSWWQWQGNDHKLAEKLLRTGSFYFTGKELEASVETAQRKYQRLLLKTSKNLYQIVNEFNWINSLKLWQRWF